MGTGSYQGTSPRERWPPPWKPVSRGEARAGEPHGEAVSWECTSLFLSDVLRFLKGPRNWGCAHMDVEVGQGGYSWLAY